MKVTLDYGRSGLDVKIPDENLLAVLEINDQPALENPEESILDALERPIGAHPLSEIARGKGTCVIVVSDITRPVPNRIILPPIFRLLDACGIMKENIAILVGTGLHRPNEGEELKELLGDDIACNFKIVNHAARNDDEQECLGETSDGIPIYADRTYLSADLKIVTGLIEPHLMAGFSGGAKGLCPGVAGEKTIRAFHATKMMEHPLSHEGIIEGNIVHRNAIEFARKGGIDFLINVTLNSRREITGVFAGDFVKAHYAGIELARKQAAAYMPEQADIVLTSSAGYPLDRTFYQTIKGITAPVPIIKKGGTIIIASGCEEGVGGPEYEKLVRSFKTLDEFMDAILNRGFSSIDQWQLEQLAYAGRKAEVFLYSGGLDRELQKELFVEPVDSVEEGIEKALARHGGDAKIAVIPKGPYVLPAVRK